MELITVGINFQTMRIRIQDYNLRLSDLMKFPAWEYALDEEERKGQDERTVRPCLEKMPKNLTSSYIIVRASFILADGSQMKGLIKPETLNKSGFMSTIIPYDLSPTLVTDEWQMQFGYGSLKPSPDEIAEKYRMLAKKPHEVFPIRFSSDVKVINKITEGELEGFMYFDAGTEDFFNLQSSNIIYIK